MQNQNGWIILHRKIRNHWIWKNPDRLKAWIFILMEVNHSPMKVSVGNHIVQCDRGQSVHSLHIWSKRLGDNWSLMKVRGYFRMLEEDGMIIRERLANTTRITVCNYDSYQMSEHSHNIPVAPPEHSRNTSGTSSEHSDNIPATTNNKEKNKDKEYINKILLSQISGENLKEKDKPIFEDTMMFFDCIKNNLESQEISTVRLRRAKAKNWIRPIRLILQQKEADRDQLSQLAAFLRRDPFWKKVILSTEKLREKLPQLLMAMKQARNVNKPGDDDPHFGYGDHDEAEGL